MNRSIMSYSAEEVRKMLREEAKKLCERLAPIAIEVEVIEALRNIKVFVKCIDEVDELVERITKRKA